MQILRGPSALSQFKKEKILGQVQHVLPLCSDISAHYCHFIDHDKALNHGQAAILEKLLDYGSHRKEKEVEGSLLLSVPRLGTISPWSTKATDIMHHCGLEAINRVERGIAWLLPVSAELIKCEIDNLADILYDPMTESVLYDFKDAAHLFVVGEPEPLKSIDVIDDGISALSRANQDFGFALNEEEQRYLYEQFSQLGRNPSDVELMMFAQVNSEHCRHKIFNADWCIDGENKPKSLFGMIRTTHQKNPKGTLISYNDNAAVLDGAVASRWLPTHADNRYRYHHEKVLITAKVETHNHPTAISPHPGAATGSGGEIRDEGATGRGGKPKAGLCGFSVSQLRLPDLSRPWELSECKPARIATPLRIMLEGPIGAAAFNNEFGRPNITGYFRSFEQLTVAGDHCYRHGYHKPIMLAGGLGNIREQHIDKQSFEDGTPIVVLGGPAMLIGLGGGAASSMSSGSSSEQLDFASVQRDNPEMQRRCQEVIDTCCALGEANPIMSIHDVGAGGLSNALPELVHDAGLGGRFELRDVINDEPSMSPLQIWCNESQERYVLAIKPESYPLFEEICHRERCLYARVGAATGKDRLLLTDHHFRDDTSADSKRRQSPIDLPMSLLFGLPPKMSRDVLSVKKDLSPLRLHAIDLAETVTRVLASPTVGDKTFLVTIGDRSVGGMIHRDQMVGPWQVPVADVGVSISDYQGYTGEAMAIGERTPLALIDAPASGRMAIGEALTNLAAASVLALDRIKLSANWMVAANTAGQDADLYATVQSVAMELCPALGLSIPVGKDSMSMRTLWAHEGKACSVTSPLSLIISAFSAVEDVRRTLTPQLRTDLGDTDLWLIDLGQGKNRLGGSILAQVYDQLGDDCPDLDDVDLFKRFFETVQLLNRSGLLLA